MLSELQLKFFSNRLKALSLTDYEIEKFESVSGGSINQTFSLTTQDQTFFLKMNNKRSYPRMFELEAKGLRLLRDSTSLVVPEVIEVGEFGSESYLLMEYIKTGDKRPNYWEAFGRGIAELHLNQKQYAGLDYDNYIGSLPQKNSKCENWAEFFFQNRLLAQTIMAIDSNLLDPKIAKKLESLYSSFGSLIPKEPMSLLHGDLWSGNFLVTKNGDPSIYDPAIYFGHREVDIAMTYLFGGVSPTFYKAYQEVYPLQENWEQRIDLFNLYPLLVHVNLFGSSYASRVYSVLAKYV